MTRNPSRVMLAMSDANWRSSAAAVLVFTVNE
jgi:hypothetical protein